MQATLKILLMLIRVVTKILIMTIHGTKFTTVKLMSIRHLLARSGIWQARNLHGSSKYDVMIQSRSTNP